MKEDIDNIEDKLSDHSYALDFQKQINDVNLDNAKQIKSIADNGAFSLMALQYENKILQQKNEMLEMRVSFLEVSVKTNAMQSELNEMKIKNLEKLL